jgi:hypothetical protein
MIPMKQNPLTFWLMYRETMRLGSNSGLNYSVDIGGTSTLSARKYF